MASSSSSAAAAPSSACAAARMARSSSRPAAVGSAGRQTVTLESRSPASKGGGGAGELNEHCCLLWPVQLNLDIIPWPLLPLGTKMCTQIGQGSTWQWSRPRNVGCRGRACSATRPPGGARSCIQQLGECGQIAAAAAALASQLEQRQARAGHVEGCHEWADIDTLHIDLSRSMRSYMQVGSISGIHHMRPGSQAVKKHC